MSAKPSKPSGPIKVNRAPVLTLWAAIVAEWLGHPPDTAFSLASAVVGTAARAKARRLGIQAIGLRKLQGDFNDRIVRQAHRSVFGDDASQERFVENPLRQRG